MDNVTFTTIVNFTLGRQTFETLLKGGPAGVQRDNVTVRLDLDPEMLELLKPLFPKAGEKPDVGSPKDQS